MQTEDPQEPTRHGQADTSDGSMTSLKPSEPDFDGSSGGFRPPGTEPPDLPDKTQRTQKITKIRRRSSASQLRSGHVWASFTQISSNLAKI